MFEKVNPSHPDKIADRIAGAIVDLAYNDKQDPKIAVEVLIGHGECNIIIETDAFEYQDEAAVRICDAARRIAEDQKLHVVVDLEQQDSSLSRNQRDKIRCGDNGIFRGAPVSGQEQYLTDFAKELYKLYPTDGKFIHTDTGRLIMCQSKAAHEDLVKFGYKMTDRETTKQMVINPLGYWTGGLDVDTGATNRKLGSDMGRAVTGGGLHGKDLSKADVAVNIYAHLKAQKSGSPVELFCAIGDETVDGKPYEKIVEIARKYIQEIGGFEKLAEWGLIR